MKERVVYLLKLFYKAIPFKKKFFLLIKCFWIPSKNIYQHLYFYDTFEVKVLPGKSFKLDHFGQQIENELFWQGLEGGWEKVSIRLWTKLCNDSKVIFDVGANTGLYSLVAKTISPNSDVYAFEPIARVYKRLVKNCQINNFAIQTEELALSNYDGEAVVYDTYESHVLSVTVNKNMHPAEVRTHPVRISVKTLSSYINEIQIASIDLIKLDVETHEPEVLEGMGAFLSKHKPTMLVEVLNDEVASKIQSLVEGLNYLYFDINETNGITQVASIRKSTYFNYLLCNPEVAQKLGLLMV